ncbi:hypothetical protein M3Y97_00263900 [Aphelenchoides bicaudatus]|nr:hypothetical protein M3Y97_00263900 [Aphelenchoides bicaudatus]
MTDSNKVYVLNSINQSRHFDFDASILANKVFNTLVNGWFPIVKDSLLEDVKDLFEDDVFGEEQLEALKTRWLERLFQHGKINVILEKFKKTIDSKVLVIPKNYILSDDIENARLGKDEATNEERMLESIRKKRAYILQLRIEIETLKEVQKMQSN